MTSNLVENGAVDVDFEYFLTGADEFTMEEIEVFDILDEITLSKYDQD
jgi:hypothetical protein